MFVYLLIAIEILVLYAIYWVTFIHEVKPPKIKGDQWGTYENPGQDPRQSAPKRHRSTHRPAA